MTDFTDDELVSAVLDGEATAEEAARVHASPTLSARLAELRAAHDAISASVALPTDEQRDALIRLAVTSADAPADAPTAASPVIDMPDPRRRRVRRRVVRVASIAAALLAVAGLVGAIAAISGRDSRKAGSAAAGQTSSSAAVPGAQQAGAAAASGANPTVTAADGLTELGSFQTPQALADAVKTQLPSAPQALQPARVAPPNALSTDVPCGSRANVTYIAHASLSGQPVIVIVSGSGGQQTIEVLDLNCTVVFARPL